jgi:hypothetical protein
MLSFSGSSKSGRAHHCIYKSPALDLSLNLFTPQLNTVFLQAIATGIFLRQFTTKILSSFLLCAFVLRVSRTSSLDVSL